MMTDLPDNHENWPENPYELLSIDRSADEKTIRRAYFKLVKKYKPDAAPHEFQKIRKAYEQIQARFQYAGQSDAASPNTDSNSKAKKNEETTSSSVENCAANYASPNTGDVFARFYQLLKSNDLSAAEAALHQIDSAAATTPSAQANFYKYYLSRFQQWKNESPLRSKTTPTNSKADAGRVGWLFNIFENCPQQHHPIAMQRLTEELEFAPELADCDVFHRFLSQSKNQQMIRQLYPLRWQAIGGQNWPLVLADISTIKSRSTESVDTYYFLLAESLKHTLWHRDQRCVDHNEQCWKEISSCGAKWIADSTEVLMMAAQQWKTAPDDFPYTQEIPTVNYSLPQTARQIWTPVAESLARNRQASLYDLDRHYSTHPLMMSIFAQGLERLANLTRNSHSGHYGELVNDLVLSFFNRHEFPDFKSARIPILDFCLDYQISPTTISHQTSRFLQDPGAPTWALIIRNDGPLNCIFNACQATVC